MMVVMFLALHLTMTFKAMKGIFIPKNDEDINDDIIIFDEYDSLSSDIDLLQNSILKMEGVYN